MNVFLRLACIAPILAIGVLSLVPNEYRPQTVLWASQLDHAALYMAAAGAVALAYANVLKPIRIVVLLTAYGALLEFLQTWIPGRNGRLIDIAADALGALIGVVVLAVVVRMIRKWWSLRMGSPDDAASSAQTSHLFPAGRDEAAAPLPAPTE